MLSSIFIFIIIIFIIIIIIFIIIIIIFIIILIIIHQYSGGAWVVLDPTISPRYMEMYADETARGGVLEVDGTLEV